MPASGQSSSEAFQDDFTQSHGSSFFVSLDPVFEEQITEAVTSIARSRPENVRQSYISQFVASAKAASPSSETEEGDDAEEEEDKENDPNAQADTPESLEARRKVVKDLVQSLRGLKLEASDREFEGLCNLILSLILSLFLPEHADFGNLIFALADVIVLTGERAAAPSHSACYTSLATIFNSLPFSSSSTSISSSSTLRLTVLLKLVHYAVSNDELVVVRPALARFETWLVEWGFGIGQAREEEGNAAISNLVSILTSKGYKVEARSLLISHLSTSAAVDQSAATKTPSSASAQGLATSLIVLTLSLPDVVDFSSISSLSAISSPSIPELSQLFTIFLRGDVTAFESFTTTHASLLKEQGLDLTQLEKKMKLLALAELCSNRVGELVSYAEIAKALNLKLSSSDDGEEVETWAIDAIRASLISGRLSQPSQSFHVTRAAPRTFLPSHWSQLQGRLESWRSSLESIMDSVQKGLLISEGGQGAVDVQQHQSDHHHRRGEENISSTQSSSAAPLAA